MNRLADYFHNLMESSEDCMMQDMRRQLYEQERRYNDLAESYRKLVEFCDKKGYFSEKENKNVN